MSYNLYDVLSSLAQSTAHSAPLCTLEVYMEAVDDGFSIISADTDTESFTYSSLQLDSPWEWELNERRYADSTSYPHAPTYPKVLLATIRGSHRSPHGIMLAHLAKAVSHKVGDGMSSHDRMALLDVAICECNQVYADILACLPIAAPGTITGVDIGAVQDAYLMYVDCLQSGYDGPCYTHTGDNPIIFDAMYDWSAHHESGGGWNRLDPTSEEDWCMRNGLDVCDIPAQISTADRSAMYTQYIASERNNRECRFEAYLAILKGVRTRHHAHVTMRAIELTYKRSLVACEAINNLTEIVITHGQLVNLRAAYATRLASLPVQIQRSILYLGYVVALHGCDRRQGELTASKRLHAVYRGINANAIGPKYYIRLKILKDRMFDHLCRNLPGYVRQTPVPAPTTLPKWGSTRYTPTYESILDCYPANPHGDCLADME